MTNDHHRRRPNLMCSFRAEEVRALDDLLTALLAVGDDPEEIALDLRVALVADRQALESVCLKFARMRAKAKGM